MKTFAPRLCGRARGDGSGGGGGGSSGDVQESRRGDLFFLSFWLSAGNSVFVMQSKSQQMPTLHRAQESAAITSSDSHVNMSV